MAHFLSGQQGVKKMILKMKTDNYKKIKIPLSLSQIDYFLGAIETVLNDRQLRELNKIILYNKAVLLAQRAILADPEYTGEESLLTEVLLVPFDVLPNKFKANPMTPLVDLINWNS
jgi:hypothetical protein